MQQASGRMRGRRHLAAWLCVLGFAGAVEAGISIERTGFHRATYLAYNDSSTPENGGTFFAFVRNTGPVAETVASVRLNGAEASTLANSGTLEWWRVHPSTIGPGEIATVWMRAADLPLREGATARLDVTTGNGASASSGDVVLSTPLLRIGSLVPSADRHTIHIFLRNRDVVPHTIEQVWLNDDVTANSTFVGGATVPPAGVKLVKVATTTPPPLGTRLAVQIRTTQGRWVIATARLVEPWAPIGTWSSVMWTDSPGQKLARGLHIDTNQGGNWSDIAAAYAQYGIRTMRTPGDELDVSAHAGEPSLRLWYLKDEPEISNMSPAQLEARNRMAWLNDGRHPTLVNLVRSRRFNAYGHITDMVAVDHYAMFDAPNIISGTWFTRYAQLEETLQYAECLKENTEPRTMLNWSQLAAVSTWGVQPAAWGVNYQFWANIMAGSKGVLWFKYDPSYSSNPVTAEQVAEALQCAREFTQVRGLCLYGEPSPGNIVQAPSNVRARMLVGENQVLCVVVNNNYTIGGLTFNPSYTVHPVSGSLTVSVPDWIPVEQVSQITAVGAVAPTHSVNGQQVTIQFNAQHDSLIYVIGRTDTVSPSPPGRLRLTTGPGGDYTISWADAADDVGVKDYLVYRDGVPIAGPSHVVSATIGGPLDPRAIHTVRAVDTGGNLGQPSGILRQGTVLFDGDEDAEGWTALNGVGSVSVGEGRLRVVTSGATSSIGGPAWNLATTVFKYLLVRMSNPGQARTARVYWSVPGDASWVTSRSLPFPIEPGHGDIRDYIIYLTDSPAWTGTAAALRLDLQENGTSGTTVEIDEIIASPDAPARSSNFVWRWEQPGRFEGWSIGNQISNASVFTDTNLGVGLLRLTTSGADPYIYSPVLQLDASRYRWLEMSLRNSTPSTQAKLYWTTAVDGEWSEAQSATVSIAANAGGVQSHVLDLGSVPSWAGTITRLRLDPVAAAGLVEIDRVKIVEAPPLRFEVQPASLSVCQGEDTVFQASAPLAGEYTWFRNGNPVFQGGPTLVLAGVSVTDDFSTIQCRASNAAEVEYSHLASLRVIACVPGDFNRDGYIDGIDFGAFQACVSGPDTALPAGCEGKDLDGDLDVDQSDYGLLQRCFSGSSMPASMACLN